MKIYDSMYWKEHCFGLTAESLVDKAVQINSLGGTCGGARKPTHFICLILKLLQVHVCQCARTACCSAHAAVPELQIRLGSLCVMQLGLPSQHASTGYIHTSSLFAAQIQPDREIITEYIKNDEFKYVRILGELYCLVGTELGEAGHPAQSPCIQAGSGTVQEASRLWLPLLLLTYCWWLLEQLSPITL